MISSMSDNIMEIKRHNKVLETIIKDLEQKIQDLQAKYDNELEQKIQDLQAKYDKDLEQKIQDLQAKNEQFQENSDAKMKDFQLKNQDFEAKNENRLGIFEENQQKKTLEFKENIKVLETIIKDLEQKIQDLQAKYDKDLEQKIQDLQVKNEQLKLSLDEKLQVFEEKLKIEEEERKKSDEILKKYISDKWKFSNESIKNNCFVLSNSNKTVEKISQHNHWDGLLCIERALFAGSLVKKVFSIKIEKLTSTPYIMIGFVVKTADNSNGFRQTSSSFMLHLYNGYFYSRSTSSQYLNIPNFHQTVSVNQIYTTILDVKEKTIRFLRNGEALGEPKTIDLKPEEIDLMSPCVDICRQGDKVSLVHI